MKITVHVPGGIGNQLFTFIAGLYFAKKSKSTLKINLGYIDKKHGRENFLDLLNATNRSLEKRNIKLTESHLHHYRFAQSSRSIMRRYELDRFVNPFSYSIYEDDYLYPFQKRDLDNLFDEVMTKKGLSRNINLHGYFQDLAYLNEVKLMFGKSKVRELLAQFSSFSNLQNQNTFFGESFCAIHIRLGDYRSALVESYGILNQLYYQKCMEWMREEYPETKFVIFSDEIKTARKIYHSLDNDNVIWFGLNYSTSSLNAVETLNIMSTARDFILGNSTFGLWSAIISETPGTVFYPWPMYKNSTSSGVLSLPQEWRKIKSEFVNSIHKDENLSSQ